MIKIRVGDRVQRTVKIYDSAVGQKPTETTVDATVVYIHPTCRFYTLRYSFGPGRSFRESEPFPAGVRERYTN